MLAFADTEAASQPREGDGLAWRLDRIREDGGPLTASDKGILREAAAALTQRPPEQAGAVPANVRQLVIAAREVFDGAGICFPEAYALDKALEPFSALVPYENQPADAAPTPPDAGPGEIPAGMKPWSGGDRAPDDWDGGPVYRRAVGLVEIPPVDDLSFEWEHHSKDDTGGRLHNLDIIAYTPKAPPQTPPDAGIGSDGAGEAANLRAVIHNDAIIFTKIEQRMRDCWEGTGRLDEDGTASNDFLIWMNEAHNRVRELKAALGQSPFAPLATQPGDGGRT
jgi:hypothetical protein